MCLKGMATMPTNDLDARVRNNLRLLVIFSYLNFQLLADPNDGFLCPYKKR